jgi:hypothetical protein
LDLPEFHGSLSSEDFVDWLNTVERVFEYHEIPEAKKTKLVANKLRRKSLIRGGNSSRFKDYASWQDQSAVVGENEKESSQTSFYLITTLSNCTKLFTT